MDTLLYSKNEQENMAGTFNGNKIKIPSNRIE
jgi:hypothetical protein